VARLRYWVSSHAGGELGWVVGPRFHPSSHITHYYGGLRGKEVIFSYAVNSKLIAIKLKTASSF
jgi:hypothetical protein